jgi:hypothetical protein
VAPAPGDEQLRRRVVDVVVKQKHGWRWVLPSLVYADGHCYFSCAA